MDRMALNRKSYNRLKDDADYRDVKFNPVTGGLYACHRLHHFDKTESLVFKGISRSLYEIATYEVLYQYGRSVILSAEIGGDRGVGTPDGWLDGLIFEVKGVELPLGSMITWKYVKKRILKASRKGSVIMVMYFHDSRMFSLEAMRVGYKAYLTNSGSKRVETVYYIVGGQLYKL
jgi:hypothetical protein